MPELPEVEILVRHLNSVLSRQTIRALKVFRSKSIHLNDASSFEKTLIGQRFHSVTRRGKYIVFNMTRNRQNSTTQFLGHLGMTGRMYLVSTKQPLPKHTVFRMQLEKKNFIFEDTRYFGQISMDISALEKLGPEPLGEDWKLTDFQKTCLSSRRAIKTILMDQTIVVGVGNIYANEALFHAKIHPLSLGCDQTKRSVHRLHEAVRSTLQSAIDLGAEIPLDWEGRSLNNLFYYGTSDPDKVAERFFVYGRESETCFKCRARIKRVVQSARSSFFCPRCQRLKKGH